MLSAVQFYNKTCRICGMSNGVCANLLEKKNEPYLDAIHKLLPSVEIKSTDGLPKNICHLCIATLNEFECLKDRCSTVQNGLGITAEQLKFEKEKSEKHNSENQTDASLSSNNNSNTTNANRNEKSNRVDVTREKCKQLIYTRELLSQKQNRQENDCTESMFIACDSDLSNETNNCNEVTKKDKNEPAEITKKTAGEKEKTTSISDLKYNPEDWVIQKIPGNNETILYICNKCNSILTRESAIETHSCPTDADETETINSNNTKRPRDKARKYLSKKCTSLHRKVNKIRNVEQNSDKKERNRIVKGCDDD